MGQYREMRNGMGSKSGIGDRIADAAIAAIVGAVLTPAAAAAVAFATGTFDAVAGFFRQDGFHLALWSLILFFAGLVIGVLLLRAAQEAYRPKPRKLTEEQAFAELRDFFRTCDPWLKVFVRAVREKGEAFALKGVWDRGFGGYGEVLKDALVIPETLPDGRVSLKPSDALGRFFEDSGGVFDVVSEEDIDARAVYDPARRKRAGFLRGGEPQWWWCTDKEPEKAKVADLSRGGNLFDAPLVDTEEAERRRREARERDEAAHIASLDFWEKVLLKTALTKCNVYCSSDDFRAMQFNGAGVSFYDSPVTVGHGVVRLEMTRERRDFLGRHPEALETVRDEDVAEHEAGSLPKYRPMAGSAPGTDPGWWYYDDEQDEGSRERGAT